MEELLKFDFEKSQSLKRSQNSNFSRKHKVKFTPSTRENIQKQKKTKIKKSRSTNYINKNKKNPKSQIHHKDCKHDFLKNRSKFQKSYNKLYLSKKTKSLKKSKSDFHLKSSVFLNLQKSAILMDYQSYFQKIDFSNIVISPILMSRIFLMKKIEFYYNLLVEKILKKKTAEAIDLSKLIYNDVLGKFKNNKTYLEQNIANLIYSVKKYIDYKEIKIFYEILTKSVSKNQIIFYLYFRQIFRFVTFNYFLTTKNKEKNPITLKFAKNKAQEIIDQGLYFDENIRLKVSKEFNKRFLRKKKILYYDFMGIFWENSIFEEVF